MLSRSNLTSVPTLIGQLINLTNLDLSENVLTKLPDTIRHLTKLRRLSVRQNRLTELPDAIGELRAVEWLDLAHNRLSNLPGVIGELRGVVYLDLSYNLFSVLPDTMQQMTKLKRLDIQSNEYLSNFPFDINALEVNDAILKIVFVDKIPYEVIIAIRRLIALSILKSAKREYPDRTDIQKDLDALAKGVSVSVADEVIFSSKYAKVFVY